MPKALAWKRTLLPFDAPSRPRALSLPADLPLPAQAALLALHIADLRLLLSLKSSALPALMARKPPSEADKAKRDKRTWVLTKHQVFMGAAREQFIRAKVDADKAHANGGGGTKIIERFFDNLTTDWLDEFGWVLPNKDGTWSSEEHVAKPNDDALSAQVYQETRKVHIPPWLPMYRVANPSRKRLSDWVRYHTKKDVAKAREGTVQPTQAADEISLEMLKLFAKKPAKTPILRVYQDEHYWTKIKPLVDEELLRLRAQSITKRSLSVVNEVSEMLLQAEPPEVKQALEAEVEARYKDEMMAYEELTEIGDGAGLTPEERYR